MKKEIAEKWVGYLRSGEFKQSYGRLYREVDLRIESPAGRPLALEPAGHCCFGVLCELAKDEGAIEGYLGNEIYLPDDVWTWAGTDGNNPALSFPVEESAWAGLEGDLMLTELNDSKEWSFEDIADLIERRWEEI